MRLCTAILAFAAVIIPGCRQEPEPAPLPAFVLPENAQPRARTAKPLPGKYLGFEPSVAAHGDGRVVVAALDPADQTSRLLHWRSVDGGRTWTEPVPLSQWTKEHFLADPWLQTDGRNRFFIVYCGVKNLATDREPIGAVFQRSADDGASWERPVIVWPSVDKPVLAVSPSGRRLVVACEANEKKRPFFTGLFQSTDQGRSWRTVPGPPETEKHRLNPQGLVVDNKDGIAVSGIALDLGKSSVRAVVMSSADSGKTWHTTTLAEFPFDPSKQNPFRDVSQAALARGDNGVIHVAYIKPDERHTKFDVCARSSHDLSDWRDVIVLAGDSAEYRGYPAIAANGRLIHVAWMEKKKGRYHVIYRGSKDGGTSWSDRLVLSDAIGVDGFLLPMGDYMSLVDDGQGTAHAVWGAGDKPGQAKVWHTRVEWPPASTRPR